MEEGNRPGLIRFLSDLHNPAARQGIRDHRTGQIRKADHLRPGTAFPPRANVPKTP